MTARSCPRCARPLEARVLARTELDVCPKCGGFWLDHGELAKLLERKAKPEPFAVTGPAPNLAAPVACLGCGRPMTRERHPIGDVQVDRCSHGYWMDGGELERVLGSVKGWSRKRWWKEQFSVSSGGGDATGQALVEAVLVGLFTGL